MEGKESSFLFFCLVLTKVEVVHFLTQRKILNNTKLQKKKIYDSCRYSWKTCTCTSTQCGNQRTFLRFNVKSTYFTTAPSKILMKSFSFRRLSARGRDPFSQKKL